LPRQAFDFMVDEITRLAPEARCVADLCAQYDRHPATAAEARKILGLPAF
jgi:hypothetical protein